MSDPGPSPQRCPASRRDGTPCQAKAGPSGFCVGHAPGAEEWRRRGGAATSRAARAGRLLPERLRPVADLLAQVLQEVHQGKVAPQVATAMASIASALIRVTQAGETEERLRRLEALIAEAGPAANGGRLTAAHLGEPHP